MNILSRIERGNLSVPLRILLYGVEGIGKSTWASHAETPLFACPEDGLGPALADVERVVLESYGHMLQLINALRADDHPYKTLVIDTADWLEALIYAHVCELDKKADIEAYGYGKGYLRGQGELRNLLAQLDRLRVEKRLGIIILAHAQIKAFNNPTGDNFDRYLLKGNEKFSGLLKEWVDVILFARYEVFVDKTRPTDAKGKGFGGARIVHTEWSPAWDAKNRLNLPPKLPLSYPDFVAATKANLNGGSLDSPKLAQTIVELFPTCRWEAAEHEAACLKFLGGSLDPAAIAKLPIAQLRQVADRLTALQPQEV